MKRMRRSPALAAKVRRLEALVLQIDKALARHLREEPVRLSAEEIRQLCDEAMGALRRSACAPTPKRERN